MLAILEQCQVCACPFPSHVSSSLAQAGSVLPHHSWSVDRPWWRASLCQYLVSLRGASVKVNSQWEAIAIHMLFLTVESHFVFSPSVHLSLWVYTSGINAAVVQVFELSLLSTSSGTVNTLWIHNILLSTTCGDIMGQLLGFFRFLDPFLCWNPLWWGHWLGCAAGQQQASAASSDTEECSSPPPEQREGSAGLNGAMFVPQQWICMGRKDFFLTNLGPGPWP